LNLTKTKKYSINPYNLTRWSIHD